MQKSTTETAISAFELEQLVYGFTRDIDFNNGANATAFFTEDCVAQISSIKFEGHAGVKKYYADRLDAIRKSQQGGTRTTRHVIFNLQVSLQDDQHATLNFLISTFAGEGRPPHLGCTTPVAISDARFECRRETDGAWRIFGFYGETIFLGTEAFAQAAVLGSAPSN